MDNIVRMMNVNPIQREETHEPQEQSSGPYTGNTLMPFGKFRGKQLKSLPKAYIDWLYKANVTDSRLAEYIAKHTMESDKGETEADDLFHNPEDFH